MRDPIEEIAVASTDNPQKWEGGLSDVFVILCAGPLCMKNNPELILALAERMNDRPDVRIVVASQGLGADWLKQKKSERDLDNLLILGFFPFRDMHLLMGGSEVLVAVLEPEAGIFSVPSKVLAYLCGGKPVLLACPEANLAARIVARENAGIVVEPEDVDGFLDHAISLLSEKQLRRTMGHNARRYAETVFDIERIADGFERVLDVVCAQPPARSGSRS